MELFHSPHLFLACANLASTSDRGNISERTGFVANLFPQVKRGR
jgi:hypothetical protein